MSKMAEKVKVAKVSELEEDRGTIVDANGMTLALFQIEGKIYAINNSCPHANGPLGEGDLEENVVMCPWHGWQFNVQTGENEEDPELKVQTYPVEVDGDDIYVEI